MAFLVISPVFAAPLFAQEGRRGREHEVSHAKAAEAAKTRVHVEAQRAAQKATDAAAQNRVNSLSAAQLARATDAARPAVKAGGSLTGSHFSGVQATPGQKSGSGGAPAQGRSKGQ